jgi:sec-independent protein translocase protein TatA
MLGNLGMPEILLIMVIALLVFGAKRLPEIGSSLGKGIREFKKSMKEVTEDIDTPAPRRDLPRNDPPPPAGPPYQV